MAFFVFVQMISSEGSEEEKLEKPVEEKCEGAEKEEKSADCEIPSS